MGRQFYNTDIEVEILSKEETEKMTYVVSIFRKKSAFELFLTFKSSQGSDFYITLLRYFIISISVFPNTSVGVQDEL